MTGHGMVTLMTEGLLHLDSCIYFLCDTAHCPQMSYLKLISTRHSIPFSSMKLTRNRTSPLRARKVQTRKTCNIRTIILRLPTRALQILPRSRNILTNITTNHRHDLLVLRPRTRHINIMDLTNLNARQVASARTRQRFVALIDGNRQRDGLAFDVLEREVTADARVKTNLAKGMDAIFCVVHSRLPGEEAFCYIAYVNISNKITHRLLLVSKTRPSVRHFSGAISLGHVLLTLCVKRR